jgi:mRNA-degrading endonuclease HigB of HigAB toxin-antitoxin module
MVHYMHLIDTYAPSRAWDNESNMRDYCRTDDDVVFEQRHVLSIRNEAFLLVVLINVEYANKIKEVRVCLLTV